MLIFLKNVESKEAVDFLEAFKGKIFKAENVPFDFFTNEHVNSDIIDYIQSHFKSWKYTLQDDNPTMLYISDHFKLCPYVFDMGFIEKDLANSITQIIENENYWFCDKAGRPEGNEWEMIINQFKTKLAEDQFANYHQVENYLTLKCSEIYANCVADIALQQDGYKK